MPGSPPHRCVFLDRDGVINDEPLGGYVTRWEEFRFLPGALEGLRRLTEAGWWLAVVSNQAGVGKGLYSMGTLEDITQRMLAAVTAAGGAIHRVCYCPHREEDRCACRKPRLGLFHQALRGTTFRADEAVVIGDSRRDIEAGRALGGRTVLVLSGRAAHEPWREWPVQPDEVRADLLEAARSFTGQGR